MLLEGLIRRLLLLLRNIPVTLAKKHSATPETRHGNITLISLIGCQYARLGQIIMKLSHLRKAQPDNTPKHSRSGRLIKPKLKGPDFV
ncbi:hypothetical protein DPMN_101083 [Dreissena polymorpha]|uniref:Secreted protein n=1 Tax=Dreissena polymorpha TaxID=45954 RepID=A0A9D4LI35_DREPO|nr:hypothetical protein DPMN_101083 [Dreissena polymorpha]